MQITVVFTGPMRRPWPERSKQIEAPSPLTPDGLLQRLRYKPHEIKQLLLQVNGRKPAPDYELQDGDQIDVRLLIGGG